MLLADIIRLGQPLVDSNMSIAERIQLLTDVGKEEVKNFYGNVFIVELNGEKTFFYYRKYQDVENGPVQLDAALAMPITLPSGGNPLNAQGIYPIPSYPLYEAHINDFHDREKTFQMVYTRFLRTLHYRDMDIEQLERKVTLVTNCLTQEGIRHVIPEKQLGVLFIIDHALPFFSIKRTDNHLPLKLEGVREGQLYIDAEQVIAHVIEARFQEAKELGTAKDSISTISNEPSEEVVSAYNKSWLWLSPTWDAPKSIYWKEDEWIKGIRLNRTEYRAFFYGTQFLKQVQTPIRGAILKEMFAPTFSAEAKQHMSPTSFETIYGIPYFLPVSDADPMDMYSKFQRLKTRSEAREENPNDIQLEIITGLEKRIIPDLKDDYRITILYYSGDLRKGDIHIRGQLEDVVPSIAWKVQVILQRLERSFSSQIGNLLGIPLEQQDYIRLKVKYLPTLLSNAYGPGYLWTSMEQVLHARPIGLERVQKQTVRRITELANKQNGWGIRLELLFYHLFASFYREYHQKVVQEEKGGMDVQELQALIERYNQGALTFEDVADVEKVGFISGCLVQQFERSYFAKLGKGYLDTRIMRFGSKLNPEMIWKNGLLKMEELRRHRDLGLKRNYEKALALVLPAILELDKNNQLTKKKDEFMTMFWSGYLMLPRQEKEETVDDSE